MTQTQKFLKGIQNSGSFPRAKDQVMRRLKKRGSEYRAKMDHLSAGHESNRLRLLKLRKAQERKTTAKAAQE